MTHLILVLAVETPIPALLDPKAGLFFWTVVVFGLVLLILWRYAWGPIYRALEQREQTIDASIKRAERALDEARQVAADNEKARREAEVEAQRILRQARDSAEQLRSEQAARTQEEVQNMLRQARAEIEQEKLGALHALRSEVAGLAIEAAEKVIGASLDAEMNRRLVDDFIKELPRN
jgi:F-type H+-transporting ATPase subunit b